MASQRPAFGYGRVSSLAAGKDGSLPTQRRKVGMAAELGNYDVVAWFDDPDVSAFKKGVRRPGYEAMMARLEEIRGGAIIFYRLDRFCRRLSQFTAAYERCEEHGVALISATEPIDTSSPIGVAMMEVLMVFAQLEARTTQARLRDHHATLALNGAYQGGPTPYGWRYDPETKVVTIDDDEAAAVRAVAEAISDGWSATAVAQAVNGGSLLGVAIPARMRQRGEWDHTSVKRLLRQPRLAGDRSHGGSVTKADAFPAILTREKQDRALANLRVRGPGRPPAPLTGLIRCGSCGLPMQAGVGSVRSYGCTRTECEYNCAIACAKVETYVAARLFDEVAGDVAGAIAKAETKARRGTKGATRRRAALEARLARAEDGWLDGLIGPERLREVRTEVHQGLAALPTDDGPTLPSLDWLRSLEPAWEGLTEAERRVAFHLCIESVTVPPQERRGPRDLKTLDVRFRW